MSTGSSIAFTHHFVDDLALVDGFCQPWELAMDLLRFNGKIPVDSFSLRDEGRTMILSMTGSKLADNYETMIRFLITAHRLPLEAKRDRFAVGEAVFEDKITITYTGR
ncbi:MAG TPA: hypothetical protein VGN00_14015 [Puia sp.]|jgi:hypothetical protein